MASTSRTSFTLLPLLATALLACGGSTALGSSDPTSGPVSDTPTPLAACTSANAPSVPTNLLTGLPLDPGAYVVTLLPTADRMYFATFGYSAPSALDSIPLAGGVPEVIYAGDVGDFAAGGGTVAWSVESQQQTDGGTLLASTTLTAQTAARTSSFGPPAGTSTLGRILADDDGDLVYRADTEHTSVLTRWNAISGEVATLVSDVAGLEGPYLDRGEVFWTQPAVSQRFVVLSAMDAKGKGAPRQVASLDIDTWGPIVGFDAANVYYASGAFVPGDEAQRVRIAALPRAGGAASIVYESTGLYTTNARIFDDVNVYWVDTPNGQSSSTIYRAKRTAGSKEEAIARAAKGASSFTADACRLYWVEPNAAGSAQIMTIAK